MKIILVIFSIIFILSCSIITLESPAQEMKSGVSVGRSYSNLGVDMQYYELRYDPNSEDYISYYKAVRQKIIEKLRNLYRYHYENGDVHLLFILKSDGKLEDFYVDRIKSTRDDTLIDIATSSLKRSSPFPPFPKGLAVPKVSFSVVISFKEKA